MIDCLSDLVVKFGMRYVILRPRLKVIDLYSNINDGKIIFMIYDKNNFHK